MEEDLILISQLNDFIFCPASIYFHKLYGNSSNRLYQRTDQVKGKAAHKTIDTQKYSTKVSVITNLDVYSEQYGLVGKIDILDCDKGELIERKRQVKVIYDGYVFQVYAQYFCLIEMGYEVNKITIRSMADNRTFEIPLPDDYLEMKDKFEDTVFSMRNFYIDDFHQTNFEKCTNCIYEPMCDRGLV